MNSRQSGHQTKTEKRGKGEEDNSKIVNGSSKERESRQVEKKHLVQQQRKRK